MITPLTSNAQAILLLTAPLIVGKNAGGVGLLTLSEYNRVARTLREKQQQPADLIESSPQAALEIVAKIVDRSRLDALLGRGFLLSQAVERWNARGIWVVSRADSNYPRRLKARLKEDAPPVLYGCGDMRLLERGGLAVVGSRHVDEKLLAYTYDIGRLAATAGQSLVSGGAKGIDRAAMEGALRSGGFSVGIVADSLERAALARDNREPLIDGKLVVISPYDPVAGFNVGNAMQRNKIIYALADAAFVVTSDFEKGGTWTGAVEQLDKYNFVPLFVRNGPDASKGNMALIKRGAHKWPEPRSESELNHLISEPPPSVVQCTQETFSLNLREKGVEYGSETSNPLMISKTSLPVEDAPVIISPAVKLFETVREIVVRELVEPRSHEEIAELLAVSKPQVKDWLNRLVKEGVVEKLSKPVRYRVTGDQRLL